MTAYDGTLSAIGCHFVAASQVTDAAVILAVPGSPLIGSSKSQPLTEVYTINVAVSDASRSSQYPESNELELM